MLQCNSVNKVVLTYISALVGFLRTIMKVILCDGVAFMNVLSQVEWLKNDEPLRLDTPHKYKVIGNGTELQLHKIAYADTGAYMCQASNVGGVTRDISSLVVQEDPTPSESAVFILEVVNDEEAFWNSFVTKMLTQLKFSKYLIK